MVQLTTNIWDRWDVHEGNVTLGQLFDFISAKFDIKYIVSQY